MTTIVDGRIIRWHCCSREITYLANTSRVKELKYRCVFCGKVGKSWYEIQEGTNCNEMKEEEKNDGGTPAN